MTFTDDDLKRLKENGPEWELSYEKLAALLARLEAAEDALAHSHGLGSTWCCEKAKELDKSWRKAAGK